MPGDDGGSQLTFHTPLRRACLGVFLLVGPGCRAAEPALALPADIDTKDQPIRDGGTDSIGTATMLGDGTILLQLRIETSSVLGDALLRYAPADPHYGTVRDHLPTLQPGGAVAVLPFL